MTAVLQFTVPTWPIALTFDLLSATTGIRASDNWMPKVARILPGKVVPERVTEEIPVIVTHTTADDLATYLQYIHFVQMWAAEYHAARSPHPIWLNAKLNNETGERRSLVYSVDLAIAEVSSQSLPSTYNVIQGVLRVERAGWWEKTTAHNLATMAGTSLAAISYDYTATGSAGTGDIPGDMPARIAALGVQADANGAYFSMTNVWLGIRSQYKHPNVSSFQPIWQCEDTDCTLGTDAARTTDSTATPGSSNTKVRVTPGTTTWANRLTMELDDFTSAYDDNYGTFLALLRMKISAAGDTWEVQLRFGSPAKSDSEYVQGPIIQVTSTDWAWYEMGVHTIPWRDLRAMSTDWASNTKDRKYRVIIYARRTVGTYTSLLDLDALVHLPIDEGYLIAKNTGASAGVWGDDTMYLACAPHDAMYAETESSYSGVSSFEDVPEVSTRNFYLPPGDGRMIIVYDPATPTTATVEILDAMTGSVGGVAYPRWLSLRGGS